MIKQKRGGDCEIYVYPDAQHGFHCDERGSYNEAAAKLAWQRVDGVPAEAPEEISPVNRRK